MEEVFICEGNSVGVSVDLGFRSIDDKGTVTVVVFAVVWVTLRGVSALDLVLRGERLSRLFGLNLR
jgi:hypothetical protein